jgi:hypothetical protein
VDISYQKQKPDKSTISIFSHPPDGVIPRQMVQCEMLWRSG